jgi:predicted RNase H-like HicB family nuclease
MRYVALVVQGHAKWTVQFPDFPGITATGFPLQEALWKARRAIIERAAILELLGLPMPLPMSASDIVSASGYRYSMLAIVAIPGPRSPEDGNVFKFG